MKKNLIVLGLASLFAVYVVAQPTPVNKPKEKAATTQVKEEKKEVNGDTAKKVSIQKKAEVSKKATTEKK